MPRVKRNKVRLNLDLPPEVKDRLEELREATNADSMSEVVRRALALYDLAVTEQGEGSSIIFRKGDQEQRIAVL